MARVEQDSPLYGKRGRVGALIVRRLHGQTIVQAAEQGPRKPRSVAQQAHLDRTYQARLYGKTQTKDPVAKALYATRISKNCTSAYTVAVQDYMNAPEITLLDVSGYQGRVGDAIRVQATDDFGVISVHVRVVAAGGTQHEAGPATQQTDGSWLYSATQPIAAEPGAVVEAEARDRPGNVATERLVL